MRSIGASEPLLEPKHWDNFSLKRRQILPMERRTVNWWAAMHVFKCRLSPFSFIQINRVNDMDLRSSKVCACYCVASALATLLLFCQTTWSKGYLATVGPKPFRFQSPPPEQDFAKYPQLSGTDNVTVGDASLGDSNRPYNSPVVVVTQSPARVGPTLEQYLSPWSMTAMGNADWKDIMAYDAARSSGMSPVGTASANDMLVVTPQMLINYFKPGVMSTNSANTTVVVPVGFRPPGSTPPPASQAIYKSP